MLAWMLHISNPLGHPSMMFRAAAVAKLGTYLRQSFIYAEDFDFSHRMLELGSIKVIPDHLVIYRAHEQNATKMRRDEMIEHTAAVLEGVYRARLGRSCADEARLAARHLSAGSAFESGADIEQLSGFLPELMASFAQVRGLGASEIECMQLHSARVWWRAMQATAAAGRVDLVVRYRNALAHAEQARPPLVRLVRSAAGGLVRRCLPGGPASQSRTVQASVQAGLPARSVEIGGTRYVEVPARRDEPPCLYVVVDTEEECDWNRPFDRSRTSVSAMRHQTLTQSIFEHYGVRPIYVLDYPVASQPAGYEPLREMLTRHACVVGAHLHTWVNPPFEEPLEERNSFQCNLQPELEASKLGALRDAIVTNLGVRPLFFKAGRYGIGPSTLGALERLGFAVDLSLMPHLDLRQRGGPDLRAAQARAC